MLRSNWERFYVVFMVLLFITGLSLAVYPYVQGAVVDRRMTLEAEDFLSRFSGDPEDGELDIIVFPTMPEEKEERKHQDLWDAMTAYNQSIYEEGQSGLSTSYAYQVPSFTLTDYGLEDEKFGVIQIPKLDLEMPIFLGASNQHMADGAAVLTETSIPIGGSSTNAVIAGHRGYGGASYFRYIPDLTVGDEVIITNLRETLTYEVVETKIIDPHEVEEILIQSDRDTATVRALEASQAMGRARQIAGGVRFPWSRASGRLFRLFANHQSFNNLLRGKL